jgi:hypothetical protein
VSDALLMSSSLPLKKVKEMHRAGKHKRKQNKERHKNQEISLTWGIKILNFNLTD